MLLHGFCVYMLQPPLLYRIYYVRFIASLLAGFFGCLLSRLGPGLRSRFIPDANPRNGRESIFILIQKLNRVGILIITGAPRLRCLE